MKHIKPFKFTKKESPKIDKLYLYVLFEGGDADTRHPEEYDLGIKFSDYENHLDKIKSEISNYMILQDILDVNSSSHLEDYDEVKSKYGEDIANMYDNVPNDPQADYQFKCYIDTIKLIGYDNEGNKYESYV